MILLIVGGFILLAGVILYMVASPLGGLILVVIGVVLGMIGMGRYTGTKVGHAITRSQPFSHGHVYKRQCPFCAEFVKSEAILCRYCRSELPTLIINSEITTEIEKLDYELLEAARAGDQKKFVELVEEGAAVNCQDEHGETPLLKAAQGGHADIVRLLIKYGADPRIRNEQGYTAEDCARARNYRDALQALRGR